MAQNSTGNNNCAVGYLSMFNNAIGNYNTAMGVESLGGNTTGIGNSIFGASSFALNQTGNHNIAIGKDCDPSNNALSNAGAIGALTITNASNKIRVGNVAVTTIEGTVDWSTPSDGRFKEHVKDEDVPGLALINKLRPVNYIFNNEDYLDHVMKNMPDSIRTKHAAFREQYETREILRTGFIAQEVEAACQSLGYEFSGLHVPENETDTYSIAYGSFTPLLVKAIQEQQAEIDELRNIIQEIRNYK